MEVDYFTNIPSEITTDILSRLSIRSLAISKCVCKPWLNLLRSDDFIKSKIKTPPALVRLTSTYWTHSTRCTIFEIEDNDDLERHDLDDHPLTDLEIRGRMEGSRGIREGFTANGLLLIYSTYSTSWNILHICNPLTREYIKFCCPEKDNTNHELEFGFGVSKISEQYKVICINPLTKSDSHYVYTLGTGTWRHLEAGKASGFEFHSSGRMVCNGNFHWTVSNSSRNTWICGFDFETECFSIFSLPPVSIIHGKLSFLRDCLCYSYAHNDEIVIWMMKEYQVDESWTIEFKMSATSLDLYFAWDCASVEAINLFKNGDVLMWLDRSVLVYYSNKTRTLQQVNMYQDANVLGCVLIFNPSLFSLKNFGFENVICF